MSMLKAMADLIVIEEAARLEYEGKTIVTPDGLTIAQLRQYFALVENRSNWKAPIAHTFEIISVDERRHVSHAITFFTGSVAEWTRDGKRWTITAPGYDAALGA